MAEIEIPETEIVTFRRPIEFAGQSYERLTLREPTAAEMTSWDGLDGVAADIKAIAIVSGTPEGVVKQLGTRDLLKASRYLNRFFA